jgi:hypothetical protein
LLLDGLSLRDAEAQVAAEDEEMARRFGWFPKRSTIETTRQFIRATQRQWSRGGPVRAWAVRVTATGALAGGIGLRLRHANVADANMTSNRVVGVSQSLWNPGMEPAVEPLRGKGCCLARRYTFAKQRVE